MSVPSLYIQQLITSLQVFRATCTYPEWDTLQHCQARVFRWGSIHQFHMRVTSVHEPSSVLIIDNCQIHHRKEVQQLCEEHGVLLKYLPPYSPDLNPIEECFSFMKGYIRQHGEHFREAFEGCREQPELPYTSLYDALDQVTPEQSQSWFRHSGYL